MSMWGPVVGFAASQVMGMVWYSPLMFGNRWMRLVHPGKNRDELKASGGPAMAVTLVAHAALAGVLNHVYIEHMGVANMPMAIQAGMIMSGISAISEICHVMFGQKSWTVFAIDHGFNTAVILAISAGIGYFL
ncbi:uncharacterized protein LOC135473955 [Liolophura sinensis]|uniref:uncharacterized protein LOC135473955 n=1 Tax=Liolophura sinensis TaxID=3198878 RepID=UPI00315863F1